LDDYYTDRDGVKERKKEREKERKKERKKERVSIKFAELLNTKTEAQTLPHIILPQ